MTSAEKLELERLIGNVETPGYRYSEDYYRKYFANNPNLASMIADGQNKLDSLRNINTDWFNQLLRNSFYQRHNLSLVREVMSAPPISSQPTIPIRAGRDQREMTSVAYGHPTGM